MSVIDRLASRLGRGDQEPNIALARDVAATEDAQAVQELVEGLGSKDKSLRGDCIKALYEIGVLKPALIAGYLPAFAALLGGKDNRLVWGAMTAIDAIAGARPDAVYPLLTDILSAAERGSVIARDRAVGVLVKLCAVPLYAAAAFPLLLDQLARCPVNQLPMYAEHALSVVGAENGAAFAETLRGRLGGIAPDSKRKRVEKAIRAAERAGR